jgi:flagellar motor switch protein FliM
VSNLVSAAEIEAIMALANEKPPLSNDVRARDFAEPRRLSATQVEKLVRIASKPMTDLETHLRSWLRTPHTCRVQNIVEAHSEVLLRGVGDPVCAVVFDSAGLTAWCLLENAAILAMCEMALGADEVKERTARPISTVEAAILVEVLAKPLTTLAQSLGVDAKNFRVVQDRETLLRPEDNVNADPLRIGVLVALDSALGSFNMRVYFGGVRAPEAGAPNGQLTAPSKKTALPQHAGGVEVEVSARLGCIDVPLSELLAVEVGDVIPLGIEVGAPVVLHVESEPCASAQFGERDGKLAIRILKLGGPVPS